MELNMWKNLHRIFVLLRFDIKNKNNSHVIDIIIKAINNKSSNQEMCKMIFYIMSNWKSQLIVERYDEQEIICNTKLEQFIIKALELMKINISIQKYEIAYDIADMLHVLPEVVIANQKKSMKQYWKIFVKRFQKKWRCNIFDEFKVVFMR